MALGGCYSTGNGPEPPVTTLYYPTALALSPAGNALFIANSDFDLKYNGGTVEVLDIARARSILAPLWDPQRWKDIVSGQPLEDGTNPTQRLCADVGLGLNPNPIVFPGPCAHLDLGAPPDSPGNPLVRSAARIGAFATRLLLVCRPPAGASGRGARCEDELATEARLFAVVRGDPSLTYFDVDDDRVNGIQNFRLDCGQGANSGRCDQSRRLGTDSTKNTRGLTMPSEPFDGAVSDGAESIVITHQTGPTLSLFAPVGPSGTTIFDVPPSLQMVVTTTNQPGSAMGVAAIPIPGLARIPNPSTGTSDLLAGVYRPGFVVGFRSSAQLHMVRYLNDGDAAPSRPYMTTLAVSAMLPISANASGVDSRGIAIDRWERDACERSCAASADQRLCYLDCADTPLPVYVANRSPPSLLIGHTKVETLPGQVSSLMGATLYNELVAFDDVVPLATGPSRVVLGTIRNASGVAERRVFVVCFDTRTVVVYDPNRRQVEAEIRTGRGPQDVVFDPVLPLAYVAHFTDSYVGVVDLDQSHPSTFETMVAGVGLPVAPEVAK